MLQRNATARNNALALLRCLMPGFLPQALSSESLRITLLAAAGAPTLSKESRIPGIPCDLKQVTCAKKVATYAGRPSPRAQNSLPKYQPTPPAPLVRYSGFETRASKRKPGRPCRTSTPKLTYRRPPPTDQSIPRNSKPNPKLHKSPAPNIREGIWDETFGLKDNGNQCPYRSRGGSAWAVVGKM